MRSRLVNVRLDEERLRKAQRLREHGVAISDLVREAIDERFDALRRPRDARDIRAIIARLLERYPDPRDLPARDYDIHDRKVSGAAILRRLARKK
jgi:hypothetical protein